MVRCERPRVLGPQQSVMLIDGRYRSHVVLYLTCFVLFGEPISVDTH